MQVDCPYGSSFFYFLIKNKILLTRTKERKNNYIEVDKISTKKST